MISGGAEFRESPNSAFVNEQFMKINFYSPKIFKKPYVFSRTRAE